MQKQNFSEDTQLSFKTSSSEIKASYPKGARGSFSRNKAAGA
jgi:hypothetical protein